MVSSTPRCHNKINTYSVLGSDLLLTDKSHQDPRGVMVMWRTSVLWHSAKKREGQAECVFAMKSDSQRKTQH